MELMKERGKKSCDRNDREICLNRAVREIFFEVIAVKKVNDYQFGEWWQEHSCWGNSSAYKGLEVMKSLVFK